MNTTHAVITAADTADRTQVTITVPLQLLWAAQCAQTDFSDYGSNDAEHDVLTELCELVSAATGDAPGHADWLLTVELSERPSDVAFGGLEGRIPSDLFEMLEVRPTGTGTVCLTATVDDQPFGVARTAALELAGALIAARVSENPTVAVTAVRADAPRAALAEPNDAGGRVSRYDQAVAAATAQWQHLIDALRAAGVNAEMQQTGGMCMAIAWGLDDTTGGYALLTSDTGPLSSVRADELPTAGYRVGVHLHDGDEATSFTLPDFRARDQADDQAAAQHAVALARAVRETSRSLA